jgi:hypothetical protein
MHLDVPHPDHKSMAERLRSSGADIILMHHAHVLQGIDVDERGATICYNLGNILFDWMEGNVASNQVTDLQREGSVFLFECDARGVASVSVLPTWIEDALTVSIAEGASRERILARMERVSGMLAGDVRGIFAAQNAARNTGLIARVFWYHLRRGNARYLASQIAKILLAHIATLLRWVASRLSGSG